MADWPRSMTYADNTYPFRAGSNYLYFGGPPIEGAAWFIEPGCDGSSGCTLMRTPVTLEDAVWMGEAIPDDAIADSAGIPISSLAPPESLAALIAGRSAAGIHSPCLRSHLWAVELKLDKPTPEDVQPIIDLRLVKDEHELAALRRAAHCGIEAHLAVMRGAKPGRPEAHSAADFFDSLNRNQCSPSFMPIVTVHGEVLHSQGYPNTMEAGQLLLVDAGAEESTGYASDITRTYPVNGSFTSIQRGLYETVLRALRTATDACTPGSRFRDIHDLAGRIICEGLVDAGLLRGVADDLAGRGAHTLFFAHGLGHLLGLDVHDMEDFGDQAGYASGRTRREQFGSKFLRLDRDLIPGMALTVEPGVYLVPAIWSTDELVAPFKDDVNRAAIDELLSSGFGGIRIEDDIVVGTGEGSKPENLTEALPKDPVELCEIIGRG
jgi:Xaa-Pro aminopeptidase